MSFHQVEVDDDVFEFVKKHAEPLVDTFNSVLRRLLLLPKNRIQEIRNHEENSSLSESIRTFSTVPKHLPQALRHILEVVRLVRGGAYARTTATRYVARQHKVFPQTVLDKYCRQLGLTAAQFDRLLEESDLGELKRRLKAKFVGHEQVIDEVLK